MASSASLLAMLACVSSGKAQQISHASAACIEIRESTPSITFTDDSGKTIEPVRLVIKAYGRPEDLRAGEVVFLEDDREIKVIPVGDLKPGVQTLTVPVGLRGHTSEELFSYSIVRSDGIVVIGGTVALNSVGYVPRAKRKQRPKLKQDAHHADPDYEIATIEPDADPNEAMAIAQFQPNEIGIVSTDAEISLTEGEDGPPQILVIRGVNLKDGIPVRFWTRKGGQRVEVTAPLRKTRVIATLRFPESARSDMPTTLYESTVVVPASITHSFRQSFSVRSLHGDSRRQCE